MKFIFYKYFLILYLFTVSLSFTQNSTGIILDASDRYIFIALSDTIYCVEQSQWHKLSQMPGVIYTDWLNIEQNQDIAAVDDEGNFWLLIPPQLVCYNQIRNNWRVFMLPSQLNQGVESIESWRGDIWLSANNALWCFHDHESWWEQFSYPQDIQAGLLKKSPQNNMLWLNGTSYFDGRRWFVLPKLPITPIFWPKSPQSFTWDDKGMPWLATVFGIYFFDTFYQCWRIAPGKQFHRVYSILHFQGEILASEYGDGIYKFSQNDWEKIEYYNNLPHHEYTFSLYFSQNNLWIHSYFGIMRYDGNNWQVEHENISYNQKDALVWPLLVTILLLLIAMVVILWPQLQRLA